MPGSSDSGSAPLMMIKSAGGSEGPQPARSTTAARMDRCGPPGSRDAELGTKESARGSDGAPSASRVRRLERAWKMDGTGGSPVLPETHFSNALLAFLQRRRAPDSVPGPVAEAFMERDLF